MRQALEVIVIVVQMVSVVLYHQIGKLLIVQTIPIISLIVLATVIILECLVIV